MIRQPSAAVLLVTGLCLSAPAFAHPMGNLSVNHYARLEPSSKGLNVTYVLDLAEIPTFELMQTWNLPKDASRQDLEARAKDQAREWIRNLSFREDGRLLHPEFVSAELGVLDGAGNLPVYRIVSVVHVSARGGRLEYEDGNYPSRAGWRELVMRPGSGADVSQASVSDAELSQALTAYPQDPTKAPPQVTKGWFEWKPAAVVTQNRKPVLAAEHPAPAVAFSAPPAPVSTGARPPEAQSAGTIQRNDAISKILRMKEISWPLMATLLGLAFWFGALHALEPGHGKTMVAAYLVGERGTPKHAALLGGMVTFTHTVSVFLLGLATMVLSRYVMPDRISKVLGIFSGLSIVWIGSLLLKSRLTGLRDRRGGRRRRPLTHRHGAFGQEHSHGAGVHGQHHLPQGNITLRSMMALGASGGLVPCPSALILLLSAISIGRAGLGIVLLIAFSLGLAIVLTATGVAVVYAKNLFPERPRAARGFFRYMPVLSAAAILLIGAVMTSVSLGWIQPSRFVG